MADENLKQITDEKCKHEHYKSEGDGMCNQGCCDKYRCLDCGEIFYVEGAD